MQKRLLLAQDLSVVGDLSLTVALPLLEVQGVKTLSLPTSLLSTQSEGFGEPCILPCYPWIEQTLAHLQKLDLTLGGALLGYLDDLKTGQALLNFLQEQSLSLTVIDPVFADEGKFYPNLGPEHLALQKELLQVADYATPNVTEAQFLTGIRLSDEPSKAEFCALLEQTQRLVKATGQVVITGLSFGAEKGCLWLEEGTLKQCSSPKLAGHFYGSGDVFAALLTGALWQGASFSQAIKKATKETYEALCETAKNYSKRQEGIDISRLLQKL